MSENIKKKSFLKKAIFFGLLVLAVVVVGLIYRVQKYKNAEETSLQNSVRRIAVSHPYRSDKPALLSFPGRLEGFSSAQIYSRVNGYLKSWYKDIGVQVKKGDVLATIDSPEIDQQLEQAKSDLIAAEENEKLAMVTYQRALELVKKDAISVQEVEQRKAELSSRKALKEIAESNLARARKFSAYKNIEAPFDGVVAERIADIGILVNNSAGKPLYTVTNIDKLRLFIQIPQVNVNAVRPGQSVSVTVPEYPGKAFKATVVRSSGVIKEISGASLVEIEIENKNHFLKAGGYAQVTVDLPHNVDALRVPSSSLIIKKDGVYVSLVDSASRIIFKRVNITHDFGSEVEIVGDLSESSNIVLTPPDNLIDGESVVVLQNKDDKGA